MIKFSASYVIRNHFIRNYIEEYIIDECFGVTSFGVFLEFIFSIKVD